LFIDWKGQPVNTDEAEDPNYFANANEETAKTLPKSSEPWSPILRVTDRDRRRFAAIVHWRGPSSTIRRWRDRNGKTHQQRLDWPSVDLCRSRSAPRPLDAEPEADLILRAQAEIPHPLRTRYGDSNARGARELVLHHAPYIRAEAFKRWRRLNRKKSDQERTVQFKDFVAACLGDLWEAITNWTPGFRLNTFARPAIAGAISDTARDWRNKSGLGGLDSDLQREIRPHPNWSTVQIAKLFATKYTVRLEGRPAEIDANGDLLITDEQGEVMRVLCTLIALCSPDVPTPLTRH
jgi:hypothetical protein